MQDRAAPRLEIVDSAPRQPRLKTPVVFVHGAYAGAWCWEEYFLPYFAQQGVHGYALSLRGHGRSEGRERLPVTSLADYVDDVEQVVAGLPTPPILIGHSMGGMVVQKYLERQGEAAAAVLMASVPPQGLGLPSLRLLLRDPWFFWPASLMQHVDPARASVKSARRAGFSEHITDEELRRYQARFGPESTRALWDMTVADLVCPWRIKKLPMLVLGGGEDVLFTPRMVRSTASAYGVRAEILPDIAHVMMLEPGWQTVADRILAWLAGLETAA